MPHPLTIPAARRLVRLYDEWRAASDAFDVAGDYDLAAEKRYTDAHAALHSAAQAVGLGGVFFSRDEAGALLVLRRLADAPFPPVLA